MYSACRNDRRGLVPSAAPLQRALPRRWHSGANHINDNDNNNNDNNSNNDNKYNDNNNINIKININSNTANDNRGKPRNVAARQQAVPLKVLS